MLSPKEPKLRQTIIAISLREGISLLNHKSRELIQTHAFKDIRSWASTSGTFAFEPAESTAPRYLFETKQGPDIAALVLMYAELLKKEYELLLSTAHDSHDHHNGLSSTLH